MTEHIKVDRIDDRTFRVTVDAGRTTSHRVTVEPEYCEKLTGGDADAEELVRKSFEFLLQREPNTSILASFELPVIGRYFPEYVRTIRQML